MASKFELSLDVNYVGSWGVVEAIRELFQNALDESVQCPENNYFFNYDTEKQVLKIGNKRSILQTETLLLGVTGKTDDTKTIGQFGEGYKLATVVLLRTGHPITFYNYGNKEVWTCKLVTSKKYNGRKVPTFFVNKQHVWDNIPDNDLTIVIENVTSEEYDEIVKSNLNLQPQKVNMLESSSGYILLDAEQSGNIYVSGLFVTYNKDLKYGYNFKPDVIPLDRDRRTVPNFDLYWETSRIWSPHTNELEFLNMLTEENKESSCQDLYYINSMFVAFNNTSVEFIRDKYKDKILVKNSDDFRKAVELGYKVEIVPERLYSCYSPYLSQVELDISKKLTTKQLFEAWFTTYGDSLSDQAQNEFILLCDRL